MVDPIIIGSVLGLAGVLGFFVLLYLVSNNKLKPPLLGPAKIVVNSVSVCVALFVVVAIGVAAYDGMDKDGWFPHTRIISVWMSPGWMQGEFKTCMLDGNNELPVLNCRLSSGSYHDMNVEFRGSLAALDAGKESSWNCQRKQDSVSCRAQ